MLRFESWLKYFFFFHFTFISSHSRAICSREKCVYTIHQFFIIKIHINKVIFFCFFLLFFLLFKMIFVDAKETLFVYYKIEAFFMYYKVKIFFMYYEVEIFLMYYETFVDWLYVDNENFMTILNLRWKCVMNALHFHFTFYYLYFWFFFLKIIVVF